VSNVAQPDLIDEETLIAQARRGDLDAFNQIVVAYQSLAYSVAYRTLQDEEAAADAVQDSFVKAFRGLLSFHGGSFKSWLIRIVVNTCYDLLRSRQRHPQESIDDLPEEGAYSPYLVDPAESPERHAERMELSEIIELGISGLPPDQRLALTLCDVHGYSYEEISTIADMPMGTVKSRINRARSRLRAFLLQYPELLPSAFRP
jgi:RNA polymerase sigma-70 factor (ECF subfamily)